MGDLRWVATRRPQIEVAQSAANEYRELEAEREDVADIGKVARLFESQVRQRAASGQTARRVPAAAASAVVSAAACSFDSCSQRLSSGAHESETRLVVREEAVLVEVPLMAELAATLPSVTAAARASVGGASRVQRDDCAPYARVARPSVARHSVQLVTT